MKFAENNRISQRQLYRQIVIAFIAPFLLCLVRGRRNQGLSGLTGTLLAVAVFLLERWWPLLANLQARPAHHRRTCAGFQGQVYCTVSKSNSENHLYLFVVAQFE